MIRLVLVELRRLFSRRLTLMAVLGAVVVSGLMIFGQAQDSRPPSATEQAQVQRNLAQAQKDWKLHGKEQVKACLAQQATQRESDPTADFGCDQMEPSLANWGKPAPELAQTMPDLLGLGAYPLGFIAFLLGAGFMAAEFSTGAMGNWLTFEPRRLRVYTSKVAAAGVGVIPMAVGIVALLMAAAWILCRAWGSTKLPHGWGDPTLMGLRVVAMTVVAAVVGAAIGAIVRHTAVVIGIAMAYVVLVEGVFANTFLQAKAAWLVVKNIDAWVAKGATYYVQSCHTTSNGDYMCDGVEKHVSFGHGALYLGVAAAVILLLGLVTFRRRDVA